MLDIEKAIRRMFAEANISWDLVCWRAINNLIKYNKWDDKPFPANTARQWGLLVSPCYDPFARTFEKLEKIGAVTLKRNEYGRIESISLCKGSFKIV
jgi:hypothetical protein